MLVGLHIYNQKNNSLSGHKLHFLFMQFIVLQGSYGFWKSWNQSTWIFILTYIPSIFQDWRGLKNDRSYCRSWKMLEVCKLK